MRILQQNCADASPRETLSSRLTHADARIRRALLRRHRAIRMPLAVGQKCFYWRDAGAPRLQKQRWRGPATVVMREDDNLGNPKTYWVVHVASLIRVAPEHLRPHVVDDGKDLQANLDEAKAAVEQIRVRSTTQYVDLRQQQPPPTHGDSDDEDGDAVMGGPAPEAGDSVEAVPAAPAPPPPLSPQPVPQGPPPTATITVPTITTSTGT